MNRENANVFNRSSARKEKGHSLQSQKLQVNKYLWAAHFFILPKLSIRILTNVSLRCFLSLSIFNFRLSKTRTPKHFLLPKLSQLLSFVAICLKHKGYFWLVTFFSLAQYSLVGEKNPVQNQNDSSYERLINNRLDAGVRNGFHLMKMV